MNIIGVIFIISLSSVMGISATQLLLNQKKLHKKAKVVINIPSYGIKITK